MMGERIAFLRNRVGWSQSQLAKELHVSLKTVTNWERGDSDPSGVYKSINNKIRCDAVLACVAFV